MSKEWSSLHYCTLHQNEFKQIIRGKEKKKKKKKERTWSFWFLFETKEAWFTSLYIGSQCYIQCVIFWLLLLFTSSIYIINKKKNNKQTKRNKEIRQKSEHGCSKISRVQEYRHFQWAELSHFYTTSAGSAFLTLQIVKDIIYRFVNKLHSFFRT